MKPQRIVAIVEGHGECDAVPELIRRMAQTFDPGYVPEVPHPIRVPFARLLKQGELERSVEFAARKAGPCGAIIILVDCDDSCPAEVAPVLLERAVSARRDVPIHVVMAKREFESWFLAAWDSLRRRNEFAANLEAPTDPEAIRGAKEWLTRHMAEDRVYSETRDQARLCAIFDFELARRAPSFDKCFREFKRMLHVEG